MSNKKLPLDLLPVEAVEEITKVLEFGTRKYAAWSWIDNPEYTDWMKCMASCMRHIFSWIKGEDIDPESGCSHLAHAACRLIFLMEFKNRKVGRDTRRKYVKK